MNLRELEDKLNYWVDQWEMDYENNDRLYRQYLHFRNYLYDELKQAGFVYVQERYMCNMYECDEDNDDIYNNTFGFIVKNSVGDLFEFVWREDEELYVYRASVTPVVPYQQVTIYTRKP